MLFTWTQNSVKAIIQNNGHWNQNCVWNLCFLPTLIFKTGESTASLCHCSVLRWSKEPDNYICVGNNRIFVTAIAITIESLNLKKSMLWF